MNGPKHTPGPWRAHLNCGVINRSGPPASTGSVQVATVGAYGDKELLPFNRERWDADARLIAAAPELAEALLYWRDECSGNEPSLSVFGRMVDAALAKAGLA